MSSSTFKDALHKLVTDKTFRESVAKDGHKLSTDFNLDDNEMQVMKQIGVQTGWVKESGAALDNVYCCCCCAF